MLLSNFAFETALKSRKINVLTKTYNFSRELGFLNRNIFGSVKSTNYNKTIGNHL